MESNLNLHQLLKEKRKAISKGKWLDISRICNELGTHYSNVGKYDDACDEHKEELFAAEQLNDSESIALAHRLLGENLIQIGKHQEALNHHKLYLNLAITELNSKIEEQRAWATLGRTYYTAFTSSESDIDLPKEKILKKAENAYYRAAELADALHSNNELNDKEHGEMKARISLNLGLIYEKHGEYNKCYECMKSAIFLCNKFGLKDDLHRCQFSLTGIYQNGGLIKEALDQINEAIKSADALKSDLLLYDCFTVKSKLLISENDYNGAKIFAKKAFKCAPEGNKEEASEFYKAMTGLKQLNDKEESGCDNRAKNLEKLADGLAYIGLYKKAIEKYRDIIDSCEAENISSIYYSIAETYLDDGENELAIEFFNKEIELNKSSPKEQINTLLRIANVYEKMGNHTEALNTYEIAKSIGVINDDKNMQIQVLKELKFYMESNKHPDLDAVTDELDELKENINLQDSEEMLLDVDIKPGPFSDVVISDTSDDECNNTTITTARPKRNPTSRFRPNEKGEFPLHRACIAGNLKQVQNLIEKGHPINVRDNCGWLPIHEACNHGYPEIVEHLIEKGAWINDAGGQGCGGVTPLHDAAVGGNFDVIEVLLRHGASVTSRDKEGQTPLDVLNQWKDDNEDASIEELSRFEQIQQEIRHKMIQYGLNPDISTKDTGNKKRKHEDSAKTSGWVSDESETNVPVLDDEELALINPDIDDCRINPILENDLTTDYNDPNQARREYQSAISNIRKRSKIDTGPEKTFKPIGPLINENEQITEDVDWLSGDNSSSSFSNKPSKRKRQTKLNFSVEKGPNKLSRSSSSSIIRNYRNDSPIIFDDHDFVTENLSSKPPLNSVKVKIKDKVFIIPIQNFDETFQWLAEEAAERFDTQTGMKPVLILQRIDDKATFSAMDKIGSMLQNGSVIEGVIQAWNQPKLFQRYAKNCEQFNCKVSSNLYEQLKTVEDSRIICLENISSDFQIHPLLKATNHQYSLRSLLFSSIDLSSEENLKLLCQTLATVPNLIQLKLNCCGLNSAFFTQLNETLNEDLNIEEINLDYNNFDSLNEVTGNVVKVLNKTKNLQCLSMKHCFLNCGFLKSREVQNVISSLRLNSFNICGNVLGLNGVKDYLNVLSEDKLISLDLSLTVGETGISQILNNHFFQPNHTIKTLKLKSCYINEQDLRLLSKCVQRFSQLNEINLSNNSSLSINSISSFIQECKDAQVPIVTLNLEGTILITEDNLEWFVNILELKLLRNIFVTINPRSDIEKICKGKWENIWAEKAVCKRYFSALRFLSLRINKIR